jgi:predicted amidohydrolase YtcJ
MISPTIYHGGPILTVDDHDCMAEAVLVDDGRIVSVGTLDAVTSAAPPGVRRYDLAGAAMTPGLIDPHGHFPGSGILALYEVDLSPPPLGTCRGLDDVFERLAAKAANTPKGEWVQGRMLDHTSMPEGRFPTREELDRITTDHPVWVCHISGHAAAANSAALAYLGVDRDTPDPRGGRYGRDGTTGDLDGLVEGMTAMGEVGDGEFEVTDGRFKAGFAHAAREYLAHGVTLAQNAWAPEGMLRLIAAVAADGDPGMDLMVLPAAGLEPRLSRGELDFAIADGGRIQLGPRKLFADGAFQIQTACLTEPYFKPMHGDPNHRGRLGVTREGMTRHVGALHDAGFQTHIHVNGDAAGDVVLDAMEAVLAANPRDDHRHTLIHCQTLRDDQLDRMVDMGVTASFFPAHVYYWGDKHRDEFLGPRRAARISPLGSAVERGLRFTIHNDTSVTPMRPLHLMWCACNRITASGQVLGEDQRISPRQALRAHTIDAAWQVFLEDERGSIEVGKRADFTILSANPLDDAAALKDITVKATVVAGETAYEA